MTLDTHSEQLVLLQHLARVSMKVRSANKSASGGLFTNRDVGRESRQTIELLTDAVHNVEGLARGMASDDHASVVFFAQLLIDRYTDAACAVALADVPYTREAIDALRAIKHKANTASIKAVAG